MLEAGLAGEQEPSLVFPNLLGRPMLRADGMNLGQVEDLMIGDEANANRSMLQLSRPIQNGVVKDWDGMEAVWDYTFQRLGVSNFSDHKVLQTEAALNPPKNREKMVEIMFERYGFGSVNVSVQAILALNSRGLTSGFVVDSGDGVTHLVPVTEGYLEPALVQRIKQKLCYVAYDPGAEKKLARETTLVDRLYSLPDSRAMRIGAERFMAPEILFKPSLAGHGDAEGLADLVFNTIRKSDIHVQKDYFQTILLSGGTTMFPGMSSRLEKDLKSLYLQNVLGGDTARASKFRVHVEDPPQRQHMVFLGASIMAEAYDQQAHLQDQKREEMRGADSKFWISRQEYQDVGAGAVQRLIPTKLS
ncbi:unnamed protein product [Effrenium voratum]|nr:unnamed protein product [Effrenium voratum]